MKYSYYEDWAEEEQKELEYRREIPRTSCTFCRISARYCDHISQKINGQPCPYYEEIR